MSNDRAVERAARLVSLSPDPLRMVHSTSGGAEGFSAYHDGFFGPSLPDVHVLTAPHPYRRELFAGSELTDRTARRPLPRGTAEIADALRTREGILLRYNAYSLVDQPSADRAA
ncbi:MAG TPA: hypothetical protein VI248_14405 [Kineosporiaceae bacterium]